MNVIAKPYHLLVITAIVLILLSVVPVGHALDMQVPGASYSLNFTDTLRAFAMLLLLLWVLYIFTFRIMYSVALVWIHIVTTLLLVALIIFFFFRYSGPGENVHPMNELSFQSRLTPQMGVPLLIMFFLFFQLSFVMNLIMGVVRRMGSQ